MLPRRRTERYFIYKIRSSQNNQRNFFIICLLEMKKKKPLKKPHRAYYIGNTYVHEFLSKFGNIAQKNSCKIGF